MCDAITRDRFVACDVALEQPSDHVHSTSRHLPIETFVPLLTTASSFVEERSGERHGLLRSARSGAGLPDRTPRMDLAAIVLFPAYLSTCLHRQLLGRAWNAKCRLRIATPGVAHLIRLGLYLAIRSIKTWIVRQVDQQIGIQSLNGQTSPPLIRRLS
jgi:hypothetical protein